MGVMQTFKTTIPKKEPLTKMKLFLYSFLIVVVSRYRHEIFQYAKKLMFCFYFCTVEYNDQKVCNKMESA